MASNSRIMTLLLFVLLAACGGHAPTKHSDAKTCHGARSVTVRNNTSFTIDILAYGDVEPVVIGTVNQGSQRLFVLPAGTYQVYPRLSGQIGQGAIPAGNTAVELSYRCL